MKQSGLTILKRVRHVADCLTNGMDKPLDIVESLKGVGVDISEQTIERDIKDIYGGAYPDPWLDNFLSIQYPTMFKGIVKDLEEVQSNFKRLCEPENNKQIQVSANINRAKVELELLKVISKGPAIKMMRDLKIKADRLTKSLNAEREITRLNDQKLEI